MIIQNEDYAKKVAAEKRHFESLKVFSALPDVVNWWSAKYLQPRVEKVFGYSGGNTFYLNPIIKRASENKQVLVASLGSGDGEIENLLAMKLLQMKLFNVKIIGFELSSDLVRKATRNSEEMGLSDIVSFHNADVNSAFEKSAFDMIIANQVLHHIVELENVLDACHDAVKDDGMIMTRDMIGMNGHQAWPEARGVIEKIWAEMPDRYKLNHRSGKVFSEFQNIDHSKHGFEGIRSQDVLLLLIERFGYSNFYAFGGVVERFINRSYGQNYDISLREDVKFIEYLQKINDKLIDSSEIKPTQMVAYFCKGRTKGKHWRNRTPLRSIRHVEGSS